MKFEFSDFGQRLSTRSGIEDLMDDLGKALEEGGDHMRMLGGGNPAAIPEVQQVWRDAMKEMQASDRFDRMLGNYDPNRGNSRFIRAIADLFRERYGWDIGPENVVITNGGQTAFFYLFNLLAGTKITGGKSHILLPLLPEYIGYANQGARPDFFRTVKPVIEDLGDSIYKYRVDFDALEVTEETAAICVSRPTNPTGNVLTDNEIARLQSIASEHQIPLIIDNAYGAPFPNIIFNDITPVWGENIVLTYSLSKIGLPGTRTGIVLAPAQIATALSSMNAIVSLANGNLGQSLTTPLIENRKLLDISDTVIRPFYQEKSRIAQTYVRESLKGLPFAMHKSEGALFLWLWFKNLPITTKVLYQRLKTRGVLIIPGEYFIFGLEEEWQHRHECIRVTFSMEDAVVRDGIRIIGEEVRAAYEND